MIKLITLQELSTRFDGVKWRGDDSFQARCPCHNDKQASLSVSLKDSKILMNCHAGCRTADIVTTIGMSMSDLFPDRPRSRKTVEAEYVYKDMNGNPILKKQKVRFPDGSKSFWWQHHSGGKWEKGRADIRPMLYGLQSLDGEGVVFLVEGEKDVDSLISCNLPSVTLPDGANSKWRIQYAAAFKDRLVYAIPDNDEAGRMYAEMVLCNVKEVARKVYLLDLKTVWPEMPEKADISDMIKALGEERAVGMLSTMAQDAQPWEPMPEPSQTANAEHIETQSQKIDPTGDIQEFFNQVQPDNKSRYSRDDKGLSLLFAEYFKPMLRYNTTAKEYYFFDGKIWKPDRGGMIAAGKAKAYIEALVLYSFRLPDGEDKREYQKLISKYGDFSKRKTLVEDARSEMFFSNEDLDQNGNLYNCQNGVFDLETGKLFPHNPDFLLSRISNVVYDPNADCKRFCSFLPEVMQNDSDKSWYLLKHCGLSLTDDTSQEHMLILYGPSTRNGKSTLLETLSYMHGGENGYCLSMLPETLAQKKNKDSRQASGDIARLDGCRMLITSEPPKRMLFDAGLLKQLLGRDTITARNLYEREFQFIPRFKLFMAANSLPVITDDTLFSSGRIQVIEFNKHFTPEEQDPKLKTRLRSQEEISGLFNLCLTGLERYREEGMSPPTSVVQAVKSYRESSDKIQNFITECMEKTGNNSGAGAVYEAYKEWCSDCGFGTESKRSFFDELKSKGLFAERDTVKGVWIRNVVRGYELLPQNY